MWPRSIRKTPTIEVDQTIKISVLRSHFIKHVKGYSRYILSFYTTSLKNIGFELEIRESTLPFPGSIYAIFCEIRVSKFSNCRETVLKKKKNYLMFQERQVRMCVINLPQNSTFIFSYPSQLRCFTQFSSFSFHSFSVALNLTRINMISLKL